MWYYNKQEITTPRAITVNGAVHSKAIFKNEAQLASLGIKPMDIVNNVDKEYYWEGVPVITEVGGRVIKTIPQGTAKDTEGLKEAMISNVKAQTMSLLSENDWMVLRELEGGAPMTPQMKAFRKAVRAESNVKVKDIEAISSVSGLKGFDKSFKAENPFKPKKK